MAINVTPNFVPGYLNPKEAPAPPVPQPNQTPGVLGNAARSAADIFNSFMDRRLKEKQAATELEGEKFRNALLDAQAKELQQKTDLEKQRQEYYKKEMDGGASPEAAPAAPVSPLPEVPASGTSGQMFSPTTPKPSPEEPVAAPAPVEEAKKFDAEAEVEASSEYQKQVKDLLAAHYFNPNSNKADLNTAKNKLKSELASELIQRELSNQLNPDMTYEDAKAIYRSLDPKGLMKSPDVEGMLKNYPTKAQKAKDKADADHRTTMEGFARNADERAASKEITDQTKDLGKTITEGQYPRVTSSLNRLNQDLDSGKIALTETHMKALKGLLARTDNVTLTTAIINKFLGVNPQDEATKKALQDFESDKGAQKLLKDSKFTGFYANLADYVAATLRKESGAAVTPAEFQTFMMTLGLSTWGGSTQTFRDGLAKKTGDLDTELKSIRARYSDNAIKEFEARGGVIPKLYIREAKENDGAVPVVPSTSGAPKKRLVFDPATGDFK